MYAQPLYAYSLFIWFCFYFVEIESNEGNVVEMVQKSQSKGGIFFQKMFGK